MNASKETLTFYKEWLHLDKAEFRVLIMLADLGEFRGNLSELCRYFSLTPQTKNRASLRSSIEKLTENGFITSQRSGNTYHMKAIPKENEIKMPRAWVHLLKNQQYTSESVAWEQVIKVFLWICQHSDDTIVTNDDIASELGISVSTIGYAKNVLEREFEAITRRKISEKTGDNSFRTLGQLLATTAWWKE